MDVKQNNPHYDVAPMTNSPNDYHTAYDELVGMLPDLRELVAGYRALRGKYENANTDTRQVLYETENETNGRN